MTENVRLKMLHNGVEYFGTYKSVVSKFKNEGTPRVWFDQMTLDNYMKEVCDHFPENPPHPVGTTIEERCKSFIMTLVDIGRATIQAPPTKVMTQEESSLLYAYLDERKKDETE